jgi:hypothetical protein
LMGEMQNAICQYPGVFEVKHGMWAD